MAKREVPLSPQVDKNLNGSLTVYAMVDGYLQRRTYFGYTRAEAKAQFLRDVQTKESHQ